MLAGEAAPTDVFRASLRDFWPPVHYLFLNGIGHLRGLDLLSLRLPSAVLGALAAGLTALLAARCSKSTAVGFLAGALMAVNVPQVLHSQEARVYALLTFLAVASVYGFVAQIRKWPESWMYAPATAAMLYSHNFGTFLFAPQCVVAAAFVLASYRSNKAIAPSAKRLVCQLVLVFLLWLPLLVAFAVVSRETRVPVEWANGSGVLTLESALSLLQRLTVRSVYGVAIWLGLFALAGWRLLRMRGKHCATTPSQGGFDTGWIGLVWVGGVLTSSWLLTAVSDVESFGATKYHVIAVPGLCLVAANGLLQLRGRTRWVVAILVPLSLGLAELPQHFRQFGSPRVDLVAARIAQTGNADLILVGGFHRSLNYYLRSLPPRIGSPEWSVWTRQFGVSQGRTRSVDGTLLAHSTYFSEKMLPSIVPYLSLGVRDDSGEHGLRIARGAIDSKSGSFWIVASAGVRDQRVLNAIANDEERCPSAKRGTVPDVWFLFCARDATVP